MFIGNKSATVDIKVKVCILGSRKINQFIGLWEKNPYTLNSIWNISDQGKRHLPEYPVSSNEADVSNPSHNEKSREVKIYANFDCHGSSPPQSVCHISVIQKEIWGL
jgi:hypothetical protein